MTSDGARARRIFSVTRIAQQACDDIRYVTAAESRHIVVFWRKNVFRLDVCVDGDDSLAPKSVEALYASLLAVQAEALALPGGVPGERRGRAPQGDRLTFEVASWADDDGQSRRRCQVSSAVAARRRERALG